MDRPPSTGWQARWRWRWPCTLRSSSSRHASQWRLSDRRSEFPTRSSSGTSLPGTRDRWSSSKPIQSRKTSAFCPRRARASIALTPRRPRSFVPAPRHRLTLPCRHWCPRAPQSSLVQAPRRPGRASLATAAALWVRRSGLERRAGVPVPQALPERLRKAPDWLGLARAAPTCFRTPPAKGVPTCGCSSRWRRTVRPASCARCRSREGRTSTWPRVRVRRGSAFLRPRTSRAAQSRRAPSSSCTSYGRRSGAARARGAHRPAECRSVLPASVRGCCRSPGWRPACSHPACSRPACSRSASRPPSRPAA